MKQYFAYAVFTACLINAMLRPEMASLVLAGISALLIFLVLTQSENEFERTQRKLIEVLENRFMDLKYHVNKQVEKENEAVTNLASEMRSLENKIQALEDLNLTAIKDLADTKRTVRDLNLANTFIPRTKRSTEL